MLVLINTDTGTDIEMSILNIIQQSGGVMEHFN